MYVCMYVCMYCMLYYNNPIIFCIFYTLTVKTLQQIQVDLIIHTILNICQANVETKDRNIKNSHSQTENEVSESVLNEFAFFLVRLCSPAVNITAPKV